MAPVEALGVWEEWQAGMGRLLRKGYPDDLGPVREDKEIFP